ncbi:MAG TPA: aminopeptidase P family protein [Chloroflexia bacterium]|nr:aminopeptidase P family protein [Chloroflexia bacterium]
MTTQVDPAVAETGRPSATVLHDRRATLLAALAAQNLDAFLVTHPHNRRYLSGFTGEDMPPLDTAGVLLVTPYEAILLTDSRFDIQAADEFAGGTVRVRGPRLIESLAEQIRGLGVHRIGFEAQHLLYSHYEDLHKALPEVELVPTRGLIDKQRTVKDEAELALLRHAVAISDQAFDEVSAQIQPGMTEKQVARLIEARMIELGAEGPAFSTIVASGPNAAMPHAIPGDRAIQAGEPIVIDMGARYHGYNSDMTRTIVLGEPDARFKEIYNIVLRAHLDSEVAARSGVSGVAVDAAARDVIKAAGYGDNFGHGTGHGIGLEVHEGPRAAAASTDESLDAGVVISIEPGIYLPGWGGVRIEDLVLLGPDGAEVLTQARKHGYYD